MKRILVIAPASIPVSSAEGIVNAKLLKALSQSGDFCIDLISKRLKSGPYPALDTPEANGIALNFFKSLEVDNQINFKTAWQHLKCLLKFGVASKGVHWAIEALPAIEQRLKTNTYDYVLTKNFPSSLLGAYIHRKYGIKWIATWNDPFPSCSYPEPYGNGPHAKLSYFEKKMLADLAKYACIHIFPSDRIRDYTIKYVPIQLEKTVILPHVTFPKTEKRHIGSASLKLLHSGNLGYPRDAYTFLKGLRSFLDNNPNAKIEFSILGQINNDTKSQIEELDLGSVVQVLPPVTYNKSLQLLSDFHIAVIIEANCQEGIFLPTKVSDYMEHDMPIFSISPAEGTLNDLYRNNNIPYFADVQKPDLIAAEIGHVYSDFMNNCIRKSNIPESYTDTYITKKYLNF